MMMDQDTMCMEALMEDMVRPVLEEKAFLVNDEKSFKGYAMRDVKQTPSLPHKADGDMMIAQLAYTLAKMPESVPMPGGIPMPKMLLASKNVEPMTIQQPIACAPTKTGSKAGLAYPQPSLEDPDRSIECTLVVRCLPKCLQSQLLHIWNPREYHFNFLFLPYCERRRRHVSYCFINFLNHDAASKFLDTWLNKYVPLQNGMDRSICVDVAKVQGFVSNILHAGEHLSTSRLKETRPPAVFDQFGQRKDFYTTFVDICDQQNGTTRLTL